MAVKQTLCLLLTFFLNLPNAKTCKINAEMYKKYTPIERMLLSQNVIFGKDLNHHVAPESESFGYFLFVCLFCLLVLFSLNDLERKLDPFRVTVSIHQSLFLSSLSHYKHTCIVD